MAIWDGSTYTVEYMPIATEPLAAMLERVGAVIAHDQLQQCIEEVRIRRIKLGAALERKLLEAYMGAWKQEAGPLALRDEFRRPLKIGEPVVRVEGF